jgi:hypothetical protein
MIIQVDNGSRQPIDGVAAEASVLVKGDVATVAVEAGALIASPHPGQVITLFDKPWQVIRTLLRTRQVVTFICRRTDVG